MLVSFETFRERADAVRAQIAGACREAGRDPRGVQLLAVTKTHPAAAAEYAKEKHRLAARYRNDREGYTAAKSTVIAALMARA